MNKYTWLICALLLSACTALFSKEYSIEAYSSNGKLLSKRADLYSNKAGIETARDALCKAYPRAIIQVRNNITSQEVKEYSPYRCR